MWLHQDHLNIKVLLAWSICCSCSVVAAVLAVDIREWLIMCLDP